MKINAPLLHFMHHTCTIAFFSEKILQHPWNQVGPHISKIKVYINKILVHRFPHFLRLLRYAWGLLIPWVREFFWFLKFTSFIGLLRFWYSLIFFRFQIILTFWTFFTFKYFWDYVDVADSLDYIPNFKLFMAFAFFFIRWNTFIGWISWIFCIRRVSKIHEVR
jgi:hypothetical protein